jgi:hypothetical protein
VDLAAPFCQPCGKHAYATRAAAAAAIAGHARRGHHRSRRLPVRAYPCPSGNGWHLSSRASRRR